MSTFSNDLRQKLIIYLSDKYDVVIFEEEAETYLDRLAALFESFSS